MRRKKRKDNQSAAVPGKRQFAQMLMLAFRDAGEQRRITYGDRDFTLTFEEGDKQVGVANLSNVYSRYCSEPSAERSALLQQHVRAMLHSRVDPPDEFADAKPDIYPALRSRGFLE